MGATEFSKIWLLYVVDYTQGVMYALKCIVYV